ncbi:MAG: hypothetical protein AAF487_08195 [Bacteroidota bacterium]
MAKDILDLPEKPVKSRRALFLLSSSLISYILFWVLSYLGWPYAQVFILISSVFLIVYALEKFINDKEKTLLDYWIFLNVLIFILALTLRSLKHPKGNFVLFVFILSAGLMFIYYFIRRRTVKSKSSSASDKTDDPSSEKQ